MLLNFKVLPAKNPEPEHKTAPKKPLKKYVPWTALSIC